MTTPLFSDEIQFPSVPETGIPEDVSTLQAILAGEGALGRFYALLRATCTGEAAFFAHMLERDWDLRFPELSRGAREILHDLGSPADGRFRPPEEALAAIAAEQASVTPREIAGVLLSFSRRVLICQHVVPWKSENGRVFDHFRASLEAEDAHLSLLELLASLVPEGTG